ncbi:MAG: hypothetical protein HGA66_11570, partial [Holophaga sp.]|nr:hypothetical protein [Holophaga sp.]
MKDLQMWNLVESTLGMSSVPGWEVFQEQDLLLQERVQVHLPLLHGRQAAEAQEAAHHVAAPVAGLDDRLEAPAHGAALRSHLHLGRSEPEDGAEHVVHVLAGGVAHD